MVTNREKITKSGINISIFSYSRVVEIYKQETGETNAPYNEVCKWLDQESN